MACDFMRLPQQTPAQRDEEVRKAVAEIDAMLASRRVKAVVGKQGAVTFDGIPDDARARMTDACIYRLVSSDGSAAAKMALARAEQLAGRSVDRKTLSAGVHSHDGGKTWSTH